MENKVVFRSYKIVLAVLKVVIWLPIFATPSAVLAVTCPSDSIKKLDRPVSTGKSQTFSYSYRYRCINPTLPTVIFIPGGPGKTSIDQTNSYVESANMIFTDPRGVGQNKNFWDKASGEKITTEQVADDILAIIKSRKLTNYVLHGHSFGAAVATIIASKAMSNSEISAPKITVLEGAIGKAFEDSAQIAAVNAAWMQIKAEANYCISCKASSLAKTYSMELIGNLIEALIVEEGTKGVYLNHFMTKATPEEFGGIFSTSETYLSDETVRFYQDVSCSEFSRIGLTDTLYKDGKFESVSKGICGSKKLDTPFDSKKWQTSSKILYVSGTHDVATPFAQTLYHFKGQTNSSKSLVCVQKGGHSSLSASLSDCKQQVWSAILKGDDGKINSALQHCKASASITSPQSCGQNAIH